MTALVSGSADVITVLTNNSSPIFNIYLIGCGLDMNTFVSSRSVLMTGKKLTKMVARIVSNDFAWPRFCHGLILGVLSYVGVHVAKPIKKLISVEIYEYFTWLVLLYTAVNMRC